MKTIIMLLLCLCLSACSSGRIQYGGVTVGWLRFCDDQTLEGLEIEAPDGTKVKINKKTNEAQTEVFAQVLAAFAKAAAAP